MDKLAVIGLGNVAVRHRSNLKKLFPNSKLYCMSASARNVKGPISDADVIVNSVAELIDEEIQLVIVASPSSFHSAHATPLINAGIPTLIEKPISSNIEEAKAIANASVSNKTLVSIGYCLRYLPSIIKMKEAVDSKILGEIYNISVTVGQYLPDWRPNKNYNESVSANKSLGGGALLELSHEFDYIQWIFGSLEVQHAILRSSKLLSLDVEDIADIVLLTDYGSVCNFHLDFLQRSAQRSCCIVGEHGRLDLDILKNKLVFTSANSRKVIHSDKGWDKNKLYVEMIKNFVSKINKNSYELSDLVSAVDIITLISAIKLNAGWRNND